MKNNFKKNNYIIIGLCMILVLMGIAYAAFASQLKISGTSTVTSNWDIEITNIKSGRPSELYGVSRSFNGYNVTEPSYTSTTATFSAGFKKPGSFMVYVVEISNLGSIEGQVTIANLSCGDNDAIICGATGYESDPFEDTSISSNKEFSEGNTDYRDLEFILKTGEKHYIGISVGYSNSVTSQPDNLTADIKLTLDYEQYNPTWNYTGETTDIGGQEVNLVSAGTGLYEDSAESGRYIYKGSNPNNYIQIQETDSSTALYRIIAKESDGTLKIIRNDSLGNMEFDTKARYSGTSTNYCYSSRVYFYNGCNVWGSKTTMLDSSGNSVTKMPRKYGSTATYVLPDTEAYINTYLNSTWYGTLSSDFTSKIENHLFNVGHVVSNATLENMISQEKTYLWRGNVALMNITDYIKANSNEVSCGSISLLNNSSYNICQPTNWLFNSADQWSLAPTFSTYMSSSRSGWDIVYYVSSNGTIVWDIAFGKGGFGARPVLYLSSTIKFEDGTDGSSSNPYKL